MASEIGEAQTRGKMCIRDRYYGNKSSLTKAIDNLSFDVSKGEFVAIMGASGSGKTTLLNLSLIHI